MSADTRTLRPGTASDSTHPRLTRDQVSTLPAVVDVATVAQVLGLSRTSVYERIRDGDWPTPVFRLGKLIRIPTAPLLALLGVEPTTEPLEPEESKEGHGRVSTVGTS